MPEATARIDTVLEPSFANGLEELPVEEVRRRRDEALAEREFQSYLRRLLQARQDLLVAERERRVTGEPAAPLVERITAALSEGPAHSPGRGEAFRNVLSDEDLDEANRRADEVLQLGTSDPTALSDEGLAGALAGISGAERTVSKARAAVIRVHDRLQDELKRRYREDPSLIPQA